ncbi:hypothetical protein TI04_11150, partial [Achromatium sp. WMS2]
MFGFRFIKAQPTERLLLYYKGQVIREGSGIAMLYFAPLTSLVRIPLASVDVPFIFNEISADFQEVSIQGQLTYRVQDPHKLAALMNYTLAYNARDYIAEDPQKLPQRLLNHTHASVNSAMKCLKLRDALTAGTELVNELRDSLQADDTIKSLGIEILALSILAIKPTKETARALEAESREAVLRQADEAIYARRNAAVEREREIKENELNTEIAIEHKKRQIRETQMDADQAVQRKQRELSEAKMQTEIALEEQKRNLVALTVANAKEEADAKAYALTVMMQAVAGVDPQIVQALTNVHMAPEQLIAQAFYELGRG